MTRAALVAEQPMDVNRRTDSSPPGVVTRVATWILLGVAPLVVASFFLAASFAHHSLAYDVRKAYLPAAHAVLHGESPYPASDSPALVAETAYVYPPPLAYALTPLTPLPLNVAVTIAALLALAALVGTLIVLEVRDWRCYGAALVWAPVLIGVQTASASVVLPLAAALAWRYRSKVAIPAASLGLAAAVKLVLWPLFVWTAATRRLRAMVWGIVIGLVSALGTWAILGFEDLGGYSDLLRRLTDLEAANTYSFVGVSSELGLGETFGKALATASGAALLVACVILARRGDDFRSFTCALASALALSPILWQHYLVLLLVPLAIARPRFSAIWLLPVLLWLSPRTDNGEGVQTLFPALGAAVLLALVLARPRSAEGVSASPADARP